MTEARAEMPRPSDLEERVWARAEGGGTVKVARGLMRAGMLFLPWTSSVVASEVPAVAEVVADVAVEGEAF